MISPDRSGFETESIKREQSYPRYVKQILIVSTSRKEANSIVLLESMAAGTPWVSFDVGSARQNAGGIVAGNFDEMIESVTRLLRNPELKRDLGNAGRFQAAAKHDWDGIVDEYEQLYEGAVATKALTTSSSSASRVA